MAAELPQQLCRSRAGGSRPRGVNCSRPLATDVPPTEMVAISIVFRKPDFFFWALGAPRLKSPTTWPKVKCAPSGPSSALISFSACSRLRCSWYECRYSSGLRAMHAMHCGEREARE